MQSYRWTQTLVLITVLIFESHITAKKEYEILDPIIKCGECPCVNPCSQQPPPPPPPPPPQCISPPPPRFVYTTVLTPPPPPRFHYLTGPPGSLYPLDPFNKIYAINAARKYSSEVRMILGLVYAVLQLLV